MASLAVLFVPGLIVGLAARLRIFHLFAYAPLISVSVVSLAAIAAPWVGLKWSPIPVAVGTLVAALVCGVVAWRTHGRFRFTRPDPRQWAWGASGVAAVAVAAALISRRLIDVFGTPDALSQTFDNIFHLNAIRYILDTGNASSLYITTLSGSGFYPAGWHDVVALVATGGPQITVAVNAVNLVVAGLVWPLSMIVLTRSLVGDRPGAVWLTAIFSTGFGAFPILLLDFGVLFPNFLGTALLPAILGLLVRALGFGAETEPGRPMSALLVLIGLPGLALAHPNNFMTLLAVAVPILLVVWFRWWRRRNGFAGGWVLPGAVLVGGLLVAVAAWAFIRPPSAAATWAPVETVGQAVGELLALSGIGRPPTWLPAILALIGIAWAVRAASRRWFLGVYAVIGLLFVVVAGVPFGKFRTALTGVYYNDPPRLAALLPLVGIPLAVAGGLWVWDWAVLLFRKYVTPKYAGAGRPAIVGGLVPVAAVAAIALSVVAVQTGSIRDAAKVASGSYRISPEADLISTDEMALFKRLDADTPPDAVIVGNPWNGSSLAYAFADRKVAQAHILSIVSPELPTVYEHLNDAKNDPAVCKAVHDLGLTYVLDFGHKEVHGGDHGVRGLDNLVQAGAGQLVDQQGDAKLIKITACGS